MPLLADYAITPDVFDVASYLTPGECEARLDNIRQVMLTCQQSLRTDQFWTRVGAPGRLPGSSTS